MKKSAYLDGPYRYELRRIWDDAKPRAVWIMLNPSTADAETDDATIRRCSAFTRAWGLGGIVVVNLFAFRATDPLRLLTLQPIEAVGPQNNEWIRRAVRENPFVAVAWGARGGFWGRDQDVLGLLADAKAKPQCLGVTRGGMPRHPLFVPGITALSEFTGRSQ